jgi:hypothetical protein
LSAFAFYFLQSGLAWATSTNGLLSQSNGEAVAEKEEGNRTTSERLDLTGKILDTGGKPVQGARIFVYTAEARVGVNPACPGCYLDCAKSSISMDDGSFVIGKLDSSLTFRLLVVKEGFEPLFVAKVDPSKGPIRTELKSFEFKQLPSRQKLAGHIVDPEGKPVIGAEITPVLFETEAHSGYMRGIVDPVAVSNLRGEFLLTSKSPIQSISVRIQARGMAPKIFRGLEPTETKHEMKLSRGVTVTGRIVHQGKPLAGVAVGLVQGRRTQEDFLGPTQIGTDASGRFVFSNVAPAGEGTKFPPAVAHNYKPDNLYYVYGIMSNLKAFGVVAAVELKVGPDGTTTDIGDLKVTPGHRVSGRITLSDGKPVPPHTRVSVGREDAWDLQMVEVDDAGRFFVEGLPTETYHMRSVINGYQLSSENGGASPLNAGILEGRVDRDVSDLEILYEPSNGRKNTFLDLDRHERSKVMDDFKVRRSELIRGINPPQNP